MRTVLTLFLSDIEFRGVYESCSQGVLDNLVSGVDAQLAEDVLAVGRHGVDAREALGGNLLRRLALGNGPHNLFLSGGQDAGRLFLLLLVDDDLEGSLAEVARMAFDGVQGTAHLAQGTVLEHDAELMGGIDHPAQELRRQLVAEQHPVGQVETLSDNQELVFVGKVEEGVVEYDHGTLVLLEQFHKTSLVAGLVDYVLFVLAEQALQCKARQLLIVC